MNCKKEKDTYMFDLNGTLEKDFQATHLTTCDILQILGQDAITCTETQAEFCSPYHKLLVKAGVPEDVARSQCIHLFLKLRKKYQNKISLFDDVVPCLKELKRRGKEIGLVTQLPRDVMVEDLERLGIAQYFNAKIAYEDSAEQKPSPLPLLLCLEQLRRKPSGAVYVGDTYTDIEAARNAGVTKVAIYRPFESYNNRLKLLSAKPDLLITNLNDIFQYL